MSAYVIINIIIFCKFEVNGVRYRKASCINTLQGMTHQYECRRGGIINHHIDENSIDTSQKNALHGVINIFIAALKISGRRINKTHAYPPIVKIMS